MKVRLMYSTELEKIPDKFAEISMNNAKSLEDATKLLASVAEILNIEGKGAVALTATMIDNIRKRLADVDDSLNEVSTLMQGYINNFIAPPPPQPAPVEEAEKTEEMETPEEPESIPKGWDPVAKKYYDRTPKNQEQE